jgi:uncharacterized membrane protein YcgQ (UPF0703/DUF1980 family)
MLRGISWVFLILGLFTSYILSFLTHVLGGMNNLKCVVFFVCLFVCFFFLSLFTNYINISKIYLRLKKRYLKSLEIVIQQQNNSKLDVYADHIYHIELEIKNTRNTQMCIIPLPTHRRFHRESVKHSFMSDHWTCN